MLAFFSGQGVFTALATLPPNAPEPPEHASRLPEDGHMTRLGPLDSGTGGRSPFCCMWSSEGVSLNPLGDQGGVSLPDDKANREKCLETKMERDSGSLV